MSRPLTGPATHPASQAGARAAASGTIVMLLLGAAACQAHNSSTSAGTTRTAAPSAASSSGTSVRHAVVSAVESLREQQAVVYAGGSEKGLRRYATDKALASINASLFSYQQAGVVFRGKPSSTVTVTGLDMHRTPATATATECLDTSAWSAVYKATGTTAARAGQARRYTVVHTLQQYPGGRWMDVAFTADKGHPC